MCGYFGPWNYVSIFPSFGLLVLCPAELRGYATLAPWTHGDLVLGAKITIIILMRILSPLPWREKKRRKFPPLTCHLSPVTCHLSLVTCHVSHVICHLSHVTCHMWLTNLRPLVFSYRIRLLIYTKALCQQLQVFQQEIWAMEVWNKISISLPLYIIEKFIHLNLCVNMFHKEILFAMIVLSNLVAPSCYLEIAMITMGNCPY